MVQRVDDIPPTRVCLSDASEYAPTTCTCGRGVEAAHASDSWVPIVAVAAAAAAAACGGAAATTPRARVGAAAAARRARAGAADLPAADGTCASRRGSSGGLGAAPSAGAAGGVDSNLPGGARGTQRCRAAACGGECDHCGPVGAGARVRLCMCVAVRLRARDRLRVLMSGGAVGDGAGSGAHGARARADAECDAERIEFERTAPSPCGRIAIIGLARTPRCYWRCCATCLLPRGPWFGYRDGHYRAATTATTRACGGTACCCCCCRTSEVGRWGPQRHG